MACNVKRGSSAWEAAGKIHGDIQAGFIRAEVVSWRTWSRPAATPAPGDRGKLRVEGRDYVMRDGDVMTVKV